MVAQVGHARYITQQACLTAGIPASSLDAEVASRVPLSLLPRDAQLGVVVAEKESGLVAALRQMGMSTAAYWCSWAAFDVSAAFITAGSIVLWGAASAARLAPSSACAPSPRQRVPPGR